MAKVGRNDPCPCGSGKKYKNCCMRQDRLSVSRELNIRADEALLLNALYQFAQTRRFASATSSAFAVFWGGVYDLDGLQEIESDDIRRTFEWFIHDYHVGDDRRHLIDIFLENQGDQLPPEARSLLEAWADSSMGLFRVLGSGGDARLSLYDCLRRVELEAKDPTLARNAQRGDLVIGRHYLLAGMTNLSMMSLLLPGEFEQPLVEYLQNAFDIYHGEHPDAEWDVFLRENGHLFSAFLLSDKAQSLRSLIGPGTRYHDPAISRDKLRALTQQRRQEHIREQRRERQQPETSRAPVHRTSAGIILPGIAEEPAAEKTQEEQEAKPRILIPGRDV